MILLVDNYDSFVHNLARYFELLGQTTRVVRNDQVDTDWIDARDVDALIFSPGPCAPDQAGNSLKLLNAYIGRLPILGVCLGHQAIVQSLGGNIVRSEQPVHGRTSRIRHDEKQEFEGLPNPLEVARYHSLIAEPSSLPKSLTVSSTTEDGTIMSIRHREFPVVGWQFHPESILTPDGFSMLAAFLKLASLPVTQLPAFEHELPGKDDKPNEQWPSGVSF